MTKTLAAAQITWFAKASFLKQNNQNLHLKLKKNYKYQFYYIWIRILKLLGEYWWFKDVESDSTGY